MEISQVKDLHGMVIGIRRSLRLEGDPEVLADVNKTLPVLNCSSI